MRALAVCFFLLAGFLPSTETTQYLRSRYGKPDVERFTVRPGMSVTVEYGDDDQLCQVVIEPKQPIIHKAEPLRYMFPELVGSVIDEVAPPGQRGPLVNALLESMGCAEGRIEEYANVWISRTTDTCLPLKPERERSARIVFKRQACPPTPYIDGHGSGRE